MTALINVENKLRGFQVGGVDYITKPFEEAEVMARVKTHLALRNTQKQLQEEIAERRQTEIELQLAKESAEAASQAKSTFLANMSHELRTPLNAILGFSRIMGRSQTIPSGEKKNLAIIRRSGEHLLTLINQVLDLSKIEAGRLIPDERNFGLHTMLSELEDMFRIHADRKSLRLVFDCARDVPSHIRGDEIRLRQVLINLLDNALKFTKEGSVSLRVRKEGCRTEIGMGKPPPFLTLLFEIGDTGPGIASGEMDMLFDAFVQTETGRQTRKGTGLGLAISKQFVRLMGGNIAVRSDPGSGTTFTFDMRACIAKAAEDNALADRRAVALEPGQPRHRILITDDRPDNRKLLVSLLALFGFELREAGGGQEAFEIWKEWKPHLIWMDIRMPLMDGCEAAKKIRGEELRAKSGDPGTRNTVIIAISAGTYEEHDAAISGGCDDFLRKPFREEDIFGLMTRHSGIRFVYEERRIESGARKTGRRGALTSEALSVLPDHVLAEFRRVAEIADMRTAKYLTEQIRTEHESLADALAELLEDFRFDTLQELFGKEE